VILLICEVEGKAFPSFQKFLKLTDWRKARNVH